TQTLAVAMKGVRPDVQQAILRNLSARARETLLEEMDLLGPVRRRDAEAAQTEIVARISEHDDAGEIVISRHSGGPIGQRASRPLGRRHPPRRPEFGRAS